MAVFRTATAENIGPASAGDAVPHATSMLGHSSSQSQVFQTMESVLDLLRKVDDPIKLGKELGVDDETLREIEGHGGNSEQQMSEVIDTWIKKKISWKTLADAVERIGYHQSAQEIRSWKNTICKTGKTVASFPGFLSFSHTEKTGS